MTVAEGPARCDLIVRTRPDKFVDAANTSPETWDRALALLDYKSFLNMSYIPAAGTVTPLGEGTVHTHYKFHMVLGAPPGQMFTMGVSRPHVARFISSVNRMRTLA